MRSRPSRIRSGAGALGALRRWFRCAPDWDTPAVMVNGAISTHERRDAQDEGWHGCFDELERLLAG
jgi:hypothetical protein